MLTIFSGETEQNLNSLMEYVSGEFVSPRMDVLHILVESKEHGTAVGVLAPLLGQEIFVTAVQDIIIDEDVTIIFKSYDKTGYMLETNKLKLDDIKSVCPFKSPFENPWLRGLTDRKAD
jgi:hypothetical protein